MSACTQAVPSAALNESLVEVDVDPLTAEPVAVEPELLKLRASWPDVALEVDGAIRRSDPKIARPTGDAGPWICERVERADLDALSQALFEIFDVDEDADLFALEQPVVDQPEVGFYPLDRLRQEALDLSLVGDGRKAP